MQRPERAGEAAMERMIQQRIPPGASWDGTLTIHEEVLGALWQQLALLMGDRGAHAVFGRAVRVAQQREPLVGQVEVNETGLDFAALRAELSLAEAEARYAAARALVRTVAEVLESLIGEGLLLVLLGEVVQNLQRRRETAAQPMNERAAGEHGR
ncbi:MAG: hypothetical protein HY690_14115 [Chloroflexi bacterium]|nr:hypothetical protein [Chloroflexota bacterium]